MAAIFNNISDPKLIELLIDGGVGVLPTDTVYGLVCRASNQTAVKRLYGLKKREHKPGTLIAANIDQLVELGFKRRYLTAVEQFWPSSRPSSGFSKGKSKTLPKAKKLEGSLLGWPGPVSVETPFSDLKNAYITQGRPTIGVRIPDNKNLLDMLSKIGPLQTTSANLEGKPTANTTREAKAYFGDKVDFYVDGGNLGDRKPSTIVRIVDDAIEVLRQGAVKIN